MGPEHVSRIEMKVDIGIFVGNEKIRCRRRWRIINGSELTFTDGANICASTGNIASTRANNLRGIRLRQ